MNSYKIRIANNPVIKNKPFSQTVKLSNDAVYAIAIMSTAIFSQDRDSYFQIFDSSSRKLNIDDLMNESGAIVLEGESAFELYPEPNKTWFESIDDVDENAEITKNYTVKVEGYSDFYLLQFDNDDFYQGLMQFFKWVGLEPADFLRYLHDGDQYLEF